jgi:hypothetical protein
VRLSVSYYIYKFTNHWKLIKAFLDAWKDTCSAIHDNPTLVIPKGKTFMLQPVWFQGPCNSATIYIKVNYRLTIYLGKMHSCGF